MLITYIVTITVKPGLSGKWKEWMLGTHIPHVIETGYLLTGSGKIYLQKPLKDFDEAGPFTFQVHYYFESEEKLQEYRDKHGLTLKVEYDESGYGQKNGKEEEGDAPVVSRYVLVAA